MTDKVIEVIGIDKFFGKKHVVKNLSLTVNKGEIYGFLGPNGSGKTTSLRIICGLLKADSGTGSCLGFPLNDRRIKENVGYMTQKFSFYEDLSIEENLQFVVRMYGVKNGKTVIKQTLEQLGLTSRRQQLAGTLSGGWKQRLALSACLLHKPKLLLLDEPTAGVDPKARREFWDQIHLLSEQGITTFVSTHYMDEAERCTRLAYIAYGELLCQGTTEDIINHVGLSTFKLTGKNVLAIAEPLRKEKAIDQVAVFGQSLHVSGTDKAALTSVLNQSKQAGLTIEPIESQLEDAFIHLVNSSHDNV